MKHRTKLSFQRSAEAVGDRIAKVLMLGTLVILLWGYGVVSHRYGLFPYPFLKTVVSNAREVLKPFLGSSTESLPWWYAKASPKIVKARTLLEDKVSPGLVLVSGVGDDNELFARIIDNDGNVVHQWDLNWFDLWPNPDHLPEEVKPKSKPGAAIDGTLLMSNGDLVFNFDNLGLIRVDYCGAVAWRLPYRTHHSVVLDDDGALWVPGLIVRDSAAPRVPNHQAPFTDFTLLHVSPQGEILEQISVFELLLKNGLQGLLYLSNIDNWRTTVTGDTLHLNDIEPFPISLKPGLFSPGDIMVSLRNINTILVFNADSKIVKYASIGSVVRQHDPDFLDGNTISVFDNNNLSSAARGDHPDDPALSSRIVVIDARTDETKVVFQGSLDAPFFTDIMGRHENLPNGNVMLTEARRGRAFEITSDGQLAWEYHNIVDGGLVGLIDTATRLPPRYDSLSFEAFGARCRSSSTGPST
jgi:hypothetical protein